MATPNTPGAPIDNELMETPIVVKNLDTGNIHLVDGDGDVAAKPPDSVAKKLWKRFYHTEHSAPGGSEKMVEEEEKAQAMGCWCF
mmetsp:Transcript_10939/g.19792  ORF Transcript_10939/g.19792 Transcript_10939/m.19792 type:complete len:85 (+) Transcript_10939:170-424(+)